MLFWPFQGVESIYDLNIWAMRTTETTLTCHLDMTAGQPADKFVVALVALGAQLVFGAWWVDTVASLGIVWLLVREGREAWQGEECCDQENSPQDAL
jgi:Co/Zn/Cd efflux system component